MSEKKKAAVHGRRSLPMKYTHRLEFDDILSGRLQQKNPDTPTVWPWPTTVEDTTD